MRILAALVVLVLALPATALPERGTSADFVAGAAGDAFVICAYNVGGACFPTWPGETQIRIAAESDGHPVGVAWQAIDRYGRDVGGPHLMCGPHWADLPAGTDHVRIFVNGVRGSLDGCDEFVVATSGTISATFR